MKTLIVIAGATASGKTNLAIKIAQHLQTKIISADSRQCYQELNIGVAKPSPKELATIEHFFINSHSIFSNINAGKYEQLALQYAENIFATNNYAVVVGGTGLYINALCNGIDPMPEINKNIEKEINDNYTTNGLAWLQQEVKKHDEKYYQQGEIHNPARLLRALVFVKSTGKSIVDFQKKTKTPRPFSIQKYAIDIPREILYNNINQRVNTMMDEGLLQEVENLYAHKNLKNLQTVGYTELFAYLDKQCTLDIAIENIQQNSRHYAKRQLTWFRKDPEIIWNTADEIYKNVQNSTNK